MSVSEEEDLTPAHMTRAVETFQMSYGHVAATQNPHMPSLLATFPAPPPPVAMPMSSMHYDPTQYNPMMPVSSTMPNQMPMGMAMPPTSYPAFQPAAPITQMDQ